jgi:hypothetical protein
MKFEINFDGEPYRKGDILETLSGERLLVIRIHKWWQLLFQYITFGYYKASYKCKVKRLKYVP